MAWRSWPAVGQPALPMMASISSALKARSVLERMLPSEPTRSRAAVAVFIIGKVDNCHDVVLADCPQQFTDPAA